MNHQHSAKDSVMTTKEAIERLDSMQNQIVQFHSKHTFRDIADVILNLEAVRIAALKQVAKHEETVGASDCLYLAHRILANNNPEGLSSVANLEAKRNEEIQLDH